MVSGVGQIGSSISIDGKAGKGDIMKGSIITFADVFEVHPITGATTGRLRQFLVTDDYGAGGSTLSIYPAIIPTTSEGIGTVDKAPRDRAAITVFGKPLVPAVQNLVFHRDAFATAFAPFRCWPRAKVIRQA